MTLTLTPETEARLRDHAAREGQDVSAYVEAVFADIFAEDPDDLTQEQLLESCRHIRQGLDDVDQGRVRPLSAYVAEVMERRANRDAH